MTQAEAKELIHILLLCAQKTKSNISESLAGGAELDDIELRVLKDLYPSMFGGAQFDLLDALMRYDSKLILEPIDIYNALKICHAVSGIEVCYILYQRGNMPEPMEAMLSMMEAANVHS